MKKPREILMELRCSQNKHITEDINQTLKEIDDYYKSKVPKKKGKYEGIDEPMQISSLYVWNKYNEGYDQAITDFHKEG